MENAWRLRQAARLTLSRIADVRERVSPPVAEVLVGIERRLFETASARRAIEREFPGQDNLLAAFQAELGQPAERYLAEARLEIAARLLRDSALSANRVASLVGFSDASSFRKAFKRWSGLRPSEFQAAAHRAGEAREWPWPDFLDLGLWHQVDRGELPASKSRLLLHWLRGSARNESVVPGDASLSFSKKAARELWRQLEKLPQAAQHHLLRHEIRFGSRALFDLLSRKSREKGREDRRRGVELAELALVSVDGSAGVLGDAFPDLHALALARLGNALRLVGDYAESERAFARATAGEAPGPRIESEILDLEASLRIFQRRYDEALTLLTRSIELAETTGNLRQQVNSIIQRAVVISHRGQPQNAIPDLQRALQFLERLDEPELRLHVIHELARAHLEWGRHEVTMALLPEARSLANDLNLPVSRLQLDWIEGRARKARGDVEGAATLLDQARIGFLERGEVSYAAEIALELAILCHEAGRHAEVRTLVLEDIIPVFERQGIHGEAAKAKKLLQDALETEPPLPLPVLLQTRQHLQALQTRPSAPF